MKKISRSAIVEHSAEELFALVEDVESYPRFLPWCAGAKVLERAPGMTRATLTVGVRGVRYSFTTLNENRPPEAIDMRLVEGPFKHFAASWRFQPLSGHGCRIDFSLEYEFSSRLLARVLEPLFDRMANSMVEAFARRADEIYGADG
jgi:ribosome-associated toxin RatA of RatAB toxin-antitoxin module